MPQRVLGEVHLPAQAPQHAGDARLRIPAMHVVDVIVRRRAATRCTTCPPSTELASVEIRREEMLVVAGGIVDHTPQQILGIGLVAGPVKQPDEPLVAIGDEPPTIELPGEILVAELLEELPDLTGGAGSQIGGVFARAGGPSKMSPTAPSRYVGGPDFDAVEHPAVVKTGPRLVAVREASAERRLLVRAHDAEIAQSEVLEVVLRLAEVQVEQEFERSDVVERNELRRPTMLCGDIERNVGQEVLDQLRFRPGDADVRPPRRLRAGDQDVLGQAGDEGGIVLRLEVPAWPHAMRSSAARSRSEISAYLKSVRLKIVPRRLTIRISRHCASFERL